MDRQHYHNLLDQAMDETEEGKSFLPIFTEKVLEELQQKIEAFNQHESLGRKLTYSEME